MYFGDHKIEPGHSRRSLRGGAVSMIARAANALMQIGSVLVLARLLSPEDYGLVSMVTAITGFAPLLVDLGTRDAVVQRSRVTEPEVSALFWINLGLGCGLALLIAGTGPMIARFYSEPRLAAITLVSSLTFIAAALTCQHYALLRRAMKFQELAIIDVGANFLSAACAITMAFYGLHYWALVLRPVTMNLFVAVGTWLNCRWLPVRPEMTAGVKEMLKLGLNGTGFTMSDFAGRSGDRIAIGYRSGPAALGYYQNALFVYENLLDVMVVPLHGVAIAGLSKVRDDLKELTRLWSKALSILAFYSMPVFAILAVISQDVIALLLGSKWKNAGLLLSVLALRGIPHAVERTLGWLHVVAGRTDRWMRWGVFATLVQMAALFCGLPFGPRGVVVAYVICTFGLFIPAISYAGKPLGIGASDVIRAVWRPLVGSLAAAAVGFLFRELLDDAPSAFIRAAVLSVTCLAVYVALVVGVLRLRMPLDVTLTLMRDSLPARLGRPVTS